MGKWNIDPYGVQQVLTTTVGIAEDFEGQLEQISEALQNGAEGSASEIVAQAIVDFVEEYQADIEFVVARTGAALGAAADATQAYLDGDLDMAANAQESATAEPEVDTKSSDESD